MIQRTGLLVGIVVVAGVFSGSAGADSGRPGRVVVLGLEGADGRVVADLLAQGSLPHLQSMVTSGGFAELMPPLPASPEAAWASLITGRDPGANGIVGRYWRRPHDGSVIPVSGYLVEVPSRGWWRLPAVGGGLAALLTALVTAAALPLAGVRRRLSWVPGVLGLVVGALTSVVIGWTPGARVVAGGRSTPPPFWVTAGGAGVPAAAVHVPGRWPPPAAPGVREISRWEQSGDGVNNGAARWLPGSQHLEVDWQAPFLPEGHRVLQARVAIPGGETGGSGTPGRLAGFSTDGAWLPATFRGGPLMRTRGWVQVRSGGSEPAISVALGRVLPHPGDVPAALAVSQPREWAEHLAQSLGPEVMGWRLDPQIIEGLEREDGIRRLEAALRRGVEAGRTLVLGALAGDDRLVVAVLPLPGEAAAAWGGAWDHNHTRYPSPVAARLRSALAASYRAADEVVGAVVAALSPEDVLLVVSPHGGSRWERSLDLGRWLEREGLKGTLQGTVVLRGEERVDWGRTSAYTLGEAALWVNRQDRDPQGTVAAGLDAERLRRRIVAGLETLVDPATGRHPVARVWLQEEIFRRSAAGVPDLVVTTSAGYAVAAAGGSLFGPAPGGFRTASGSALPERAPGLVATSRPLLRRHLSVVDVAPTVLGLLGVQAPADTTGQPFL